ncbi:MAG: DNA adenine methylase [Solirubrobacteraceae bacterium MAG38_C4-C5]|nr:DNA adenine methylase [Candidatus Siliceabacter maunaloa]
MARFVAGLIAAQPRRAAKYVEPFAGGGGVALRLLFDEYVDEVVLNDLNPGVAAFWRSVFFRTDELAQHVRACDLSVEEWHRQQGVYGSGTRDDMALGFATFFLNRTNRSGILDARPIGGLEQRGKWGIAARFDRARLSARIETLGRYRSRVVVCEDDGIDLIGRHLGDRSAFIYADPPYLMHGDDLYLDTLRWSDHERLAGLLREEDHGWFLTYDADPRVTDSLYGGLRCAQFQTSHTAAVQHVGSEYAVFARGLTVESLAGLGSGAAQFVAA